MKRYLHDLFLCQAACLGILIIDGPIYSGHDSVDLTIRPALQQNLEQLLTIQRQAIQTLCCHDYSLQQLDAIILSQHEARGLSEEIHVAENEQGIVGFIAMMLPRWQIGGIYVHPAHTRQGIATQLLAYLEQQALEQRQRKISVMSSLTAVPFYQSQGYVLVRRSGFVTAQSVWIPCINLEKQMDVPVRPSRWFFPRLSFGFLG